MTIKRNPAIKSDHLHKYERISKADLVEAFRDFARDIGGFGETDETLWFAELERRVEVVREQRKAGNSMLHETISETPALDAIQKYSRVPYPNNTTDWEKGDLVIHKADAKRSDMLMCVIGYTRDGQCKTKYVAAHSETGRIWTNPISELLDPALFGIDTEGGNHEQ